MKCVKSGRAILLLRSILPVDTPTVYSVRVLHFNFLMAVRAAHMQIYRSLSCHLISYCLQHCHRHREIIR